MSEPTVSPRGVVRLPDGRRTFAPGHTASTKHGVWSSRVISPVAEAIEKALEAMVAETPAAAPSFAAARGALALKLARLEKVREWIDRERGGLPLDDDGEPLPAAALEAQLVAGVESSLAQLGLTPLAAAKLGVDLVRGEALAAAREDLEEGRRLRLAAEQREADDEAARPDGGLLAGSTPDETAAADAGGSSCPPARRDGEGGGR